LIGAVIAGINVYDKVDAIKHRNRDNPPAADIFATKEFVLDMEARFNRSMGSLGANIQQVDKTLQSELRDINRSLGSIEGFIKSIDD